MSNLKHFIYEKSNGNKSERWAIEIQRPRQNYFMIDLSSLSTDEREEVKKAVSEVNAFRDEQMKKIDDLIKWRTFKPKGITFID